MSQHFWLICGLWCGVGNGLNIWFRRKKVMEQGLMSEAEVRAFAKGVALWILIPSVILWALQLSIGAAADPMFDRWPDPQRLFALGVQFFVWLALLFWVFVRGGAETLSAYFGAGSKGLSFLYSPAMIKLGACVVVAVSIIALTTMHA